MTVALLSRLQLRFVHDKRKCLAGHGFVFERQVDLDEAERSRRLDVLRLGSSPGLGAEGGQWVV